MAAIGFERLEPYDGKLSRTVLRGGANSNVFLLPDYASVECLYCPDLRGLPAAVIADTIRRRMQEELGITASGGVSFNKIFAKLGSDMKKPDATTVVTADNFWQLVWSLPVEDLLYVGWAIQCKLNSRMIRTIGDL